MKKYILCLSLMLSLFTTAMAQDYVRETDRKTGRVLLRGKISFDQLLNESTCKKWMDAGVASYQPKQDAVDALSKLASPYRFVVFTGTWCSDSKDLLPRFYKVLVEAGVDLRTVEMYGVNRAKESLNLEHQFYNIHNVPTIILMHQAREVGRIVESVSSSIEEDLLALISKDYSQLQKERADRLR